MVLSLAAVPPGLGFTTERGPVTVVTGIGLSSLPGLNRRKPLNHESYSPGQSLCDSPYNANCQPVKTSNSRNDLSRDSVVVYSLA